MSFPKLLAVLTFVLFSAIAFLGWWKQGDNENSVAHRPSEPIEVALETLVQPVKIEEPKPVEPPQPIVVVEKEVLPPVDRVEELFRTGSKLPIVETITYKSHVPWLKGRQAWVSDYASHYHTSKHFIARSYNGRPEYLKQELPEGARFNVLRPDINLQFNLVIDLSHCHLWLYANNLDNGERIPIKTYTVGLGRQDPNQSKKLLTPTGQYTLGEKVAIYKPGMTSLVNGQKQEMVRIFGTRWIPFDKELNHCSAPAKGFGIHGVPWTANAQNQLEEDISSLGKYESDGCVRLSTKDIEELFAIIITKPTVVELVWDLSDASYPIVAKE